MRVIAGFACVLFLGFCPSSYGQASGQDSNCAAKETNPSAACQKQKIEPRKETVVVTGTFEPLPVESIDRAVSVIDTREVPLLYNHWVDYLQLDPSVDLQQRAPDGVQADLTIRGSTFGQTLVLLDGLRMNDAQSGHHNMDLPVPANAIERIEILRGAGSTLYGSDAMAGSINVIYRAAKAFRDPCGRRRRQLRGEPAKRRRGLACSAAGTKNLAWPGTFPAASCPIATIVASRVFQHRR